MSFPRKITCAVCQTVFEVTLEELLKEAGDAPPTEFFAHCLKCHHLNIVEVTDVPQHLHASIATKE